MVFIFASKPADNSRSFVALSTTAITRRANTAYLRPLAEFATTGRMRGTAARVIMLLSAVVIVAGGALWYSLDMPPAAPRYEQWLEARDVIKADFRDGDGIRVEPIWLREGAAIVSTMDEPLGQPPTFVDLSEPPDPMFGAKHGRIWLVSAMGRTDVPHYLKNAAVGFEQKVGDDLLIRRFDMDGTLLRVDLLDRLPTARIERRAPDGKRRFCTWKKQARHHHCHGHSWENSKVDLYEVGGAPRRCLNLHPSPDRGIVSVTFPKVPLSAGIWIHTGFPLEAARREEGSDALVVIRVDGQEKARRVEPKNGWSWTGTWVDTSDADGTRADVTIEVSADNVSYRNLCMDGYIVSERPSTATVN
jgi:hypothetical protein